MHLAGTLPTRPRDDLLVPAALVGLVELALNLRWTWDRQQSAIFAAIDADAWEATRDPIAVLRGLSADRWRALETDPAFRASLDRELGRLHRYLEAADGPERLLADGPIAFFCAEFGLHQSIPLYAGGLGILAGDTLKAASDRGLDMVGVGLLYREGGFRQSLTAEGRQVETWLRRSPDSLPVRRLLAPGGEALTIQVPIGRRTVNAAVWIAEVGRNPLILLDADVEGNDAADRRITDRLYVDVRRTRLQQEILLGVGGLRALDAAGIEPAIIHLNEGHAALLLLEHARRLQTPLMPAEVALRRAGDGSVFTLHTPVAAGNEAFLLGLVQEELGTMLTSVGLTIEELGQLGRRPDGDTEWFDLSAFALRLCARANGVSRLHAATARVAWAPVRNRPLVAVTNGVHRPTWEGPFMAAIGAAADDRTLWRAHLAEKARLVSRPDLAGRIDPNALLIGFARRFAPYKRADLLLGDAGRLLALLSHAGRPVQLLVAGRVHIADVPGRRILAAVARASSRPPLAGRLILITDYGMDLAADLVSGVDLWLNTPRRPMEASGTSGMKAAINAVPSLSILDGWWDEGYRGTNGWAIGGDAPQTDVEDADETFRLLEAEIVPRFFRRDRNGIPTDWLPVMRSAREVGTTGFTTDRMLDDALDELYRPILAEPVTA